MLDLLEEIWGKLILFGLFLFVVGAGLILWDCVNRDLVTGEFFA